MVEEEKLAGDVYQTLYERTNINNFGNIVQSERRHQAAVQNLLKYYGLSDPSSGKAIGEFSNPEFTQLYQKLIAQGLSSSVNALKVGTLIEELDINDLNKLSAGTQQPELLRVYEQLTRGSRNHLRSFDRSLKAQGANYTPSYLSQTEYNTIVDGEQEKGGGGGRGDWHQ